MYRFWDGVVAALPEKCYRLAISEIIHALAKRRFVLIIPFKLLHALEKEVGAILLKAKSQSYS